MCMQFMGGRVKTLSKCELKTVEQNIVVVAVVNDDYVDEAATEFLYSLQKQILCQHFYRVIRFVIRCIHSFPSNFSVPFISVTLIWTPLRWLILFHNSDSQFQNLKFATFFHFLSRFLFLEQYICSLEVETTVHQLNGKQILLLQNVQKRFKFFLKENFRSALNNVRQEKNSQLLEQLFRLKCFKVSVRKINSSCKMNQFYLESLTFHP